MSGWIKLEKDLLTDPRLLAVAAKLQNRVTIPSRKVRDKRHASVTHPSVTVTLAYGALARIWVIGDTHIGEDDVLAVGADEINQLIGIVGFCQLLPTDWLEILDSEHVKLPNFHKHNGTIARTKALASLRQRRRRKNVTPRRDSVKRDCHADVTLVRDQTETETYIKNPDARARVSGSHPVDNSARRARAPDVLKKPSGPSDPEQIESRRRQAAQIAADLAAAMEAKT